MASVANAAKYKDALKGVPKEGEHVPAEEHANPDGDCRRRNQLGFLGCIVSFADCPGFIEQHEVEHVEGARHDQHHFQKEQKSHVLLRRRDEKHDAGDQIDAEAEHSQRQQLMERSKG